MNSKTNDFTYNNSTMLFAYDGAPKRSGWYTVAKVYDTYVYEQRFYNVATDCWSSVKDASGHVSIIPTSEMSHHGYEYWREA